MLSSQPDPPCPLNTTTLPPPPLTPPPFQKQQQSDSSNLDPSFNTVSTFSIRDYVLRGRSKDIKKNWPFSEKSLQLCLKHGITDPLPPFQGFDAIRNQSKVQIFSLAENDLPSTSVTVSTSQIEASTNNTNRQPLEIDTRRPPSGKPSGKKSKLVVKFGAGANNNSEDIASNCSAASDPMGSKTCPVCRTFSSPSNTTLNAHIDQCLSADSTPKWTASTKVTTRHKIKPRKYRSMVDIYTTAPKCTIEELDRRNGRTWSPVSSLPAPETINEPLHVRKQTVSRDEEADDSDEEADDSVGPVYIDARGTKVGILSKLDAPTVSKSVEEGEGSKTLVAKKKNLTVKKHLKYLKLDPQGKKLFSPKPVTTQIAEVQKGYSEEGSYKEQWPMPKQSKPIPPGTIKQWVSSKRTDLAKKLSKQGVKWQVKEKRNSYVGGSPVMRKQAKYFKDLSGVRTSSSQTSQSIERQYDEAPEGDNREFSSVRKRPRSPLFQPRIIDNSERSFSTVKRKLSKDSFSLCEKSAMRPPDSTTKSVSLLGKQLARTDAARCSSEATKKTYVFAAKKSVPFVSRKLSVLKARSNVVERSSVLKKDRLCFMNKTDRELGVLESEMDQEYALKHKGSSKFGEREEVMDDMSLIRRRRAIRISQKEETAAKQANDDLAGTCPSKSLETEYEMLNDLSNSGSESPLSTEDYNGLLCRSETLTGSMNPSYLVAQRMYSNNEDGNAILVQSSHIGMEFDSEIGEGSSFPEVEPIPIPGPPGSFLPSPRDMGSDEFQGNSSLTTVQVASSQDQPDFGYRNSSESPLSMSSAFSNFTAGRSDRLKYSEPLSLAQEKITSGISVANIECSVDTAASSRQSSAGIDRAYNGETFTDHVISIDKQPFGFKNDNQPCCCQRKEKFCQDVMLNFQDSQLLKRRTMASAAVPATERQIAYNQNTNPVNIDMGSYFNSVSEKGTLALLNPLVESSTPVKRPADPGTKIFGRVDSDSASPSASSPILRLMGKNLMVVNKVEDEPLLNTRLNRQLTPPPSNFLSQNSRPLHYKAPQGSLFVGQNPNDATYSNGNNPYGNDIYWRGPQVPTQAPVAMFQNQYINEGLAASIRQQQYEGAKHNPGADSTSSVKEVIFIETEANMRGNNTVQDSRTTELNSHGLWIPTGRGYNNSRGGSCLSRFESEESAFLNDQPQTTAKQTSTNPVKWAT